MTAHVPVMLPEVLEMLQPKDGAVYIDGTFGAGGYTRAVLAAARCRVFALDRDISTARYASTIQSEFGDRLTYIVGNFADMCTLVASHGITQVDGVMLDIGVSSMQLDEPERGFSFRADGPLDMRMSGHGLSAADVVNTYDEKRLSDILYHYGEERASRQIARALVVARPITRTKQLQEIVASVVRRDGKKDPATRTFQALRMEVNHELQALESGLHAAEKLIKPGGTLIVVSFHSLEDRLVKRFMRTPQGANQSRYLPDSIQGDARFSRTLKRLATEEEISRNPRARSAILRVAVRAAA